MLVSVTSLILMNAADMMIEKKPVCICGLVQERTDKMTVVRSEGSRLARAARMAATMADKV